MNESAETVRIALAQTAPSLGAYADNVAAHVRALDAAGRAQAQVVLFPELSLAGYRLRDLVPEVAQTPASVVRDLDLAASDLEVALGFVERDGRHHYYNSGLVWGAGRIALIHRKVFLPCYGLFDEGRDYSSGRRIAVARAGRLGLLGMLLCEDAWHPSAWTALQAQGAEVVCCLANSPLRGVQSTPPAIVQHYERLLRTMAALLGAFVIFVNRVGCEDGLCFWGGSLVIDPEGEVIARLPLFEEALCCVDLDLSAVRRARLSAPLHRNLKLDVACREIDHVLAEQSL